MVISEFFEHDLPAHGGDLVAASRCFGVSLRDWVDLSTGVNPQVYPIPNIEPRFFSTLSYLQPEFVSAAQHYYQREHFVAVAGSQSAIQVLPLALGRNTGGDSVSRVLVPAVGYREHEKSWRAARYDVMAYDALTHSNMLADINLQLHQCAKTHLVIINPNNPSGVAVDKRQLVTWANALEGGGHLVVDEAFIDLCPDSSALSLGDLPENIIVLRSFGKFFGLAGLRLGFVFARQDLLGLLADTLGLWQVNGPAQAVAQVALRDMQWQAKAREEIMANQSTTQAFFRDFLSEFTMLNCAQQGLFASYTLPADEALIIYRHLAQSAVLVRFISVSSELAMLRVGILPRLDEVMMQRLQDGLAQCIERMQRHLAFGG